MVAARYKYQWKVISQSVCGASHKRSNLPNQDASAYFCGSDFGLPVIAGVSDGHGSLKCFRSHKGANFAVKAAIDIVKDFVVCHEPNKNLSLIKHIADEIIPRKILQQWKIYVFNDIEKNAFSNDELKILNNKNPLVAYGTTLICVLMAEKFIIYWQIGDGNILTLWENNKIEQPVPKDARLFANETTSLCIENSWQDFRFCFQPIFKYLPKLILLTTDGYTNSFKNEKDFLQLAPDIYQMIELYGYDYVKKNLQIWLNHASEKGSGDDISAAIICRTIT